LEGAASCSSLPPILTFPRKETVDEHDSCRPYAYTYSYTYTDWCVFEYEYEYEYVYVYGGWHAFCRGKALPRERENRQSPRGGKEPFS
jgi:hypothetical protein